MHIPAFAKKKTTIGILIVLIIGAYALLKPKDQNGSEFTQVKRAVLLQEVSVTGRVKPTKQVDLVFEQSGTVARVPVAVGSRVAPGQTLVALENSEINAQFLQAQANVETEQAKLEELQKGTRPEELQAARTQVANAERSLSNAQNNLDTTREKATADFQETYVAAITAAQKSMSVSKTALLTLTAIQYEHFTARDQDGIALSEAKRDAVAIVLGGVNGGDWSQAAVSSAEGGAFAEVKNALIKPTNENIDHTLNNAINGLQAVKAALDAVPVTATLTATESASIATEKTNINTEITALTQKQQAVLVQKAYNTNAIAASASSFATAQNTVATAQDNLALKTAGATEEQIAAEVARVKSAQANAQAIASRLAKTTLHSPFAGMVTKVEATVGENIAANAPVASVTADAPFEIETDVPEADIAKVKLNDAAKVTLDAYGNDVIFSAAVTSIEPAETMIDGVATYATKLQFAKPDERIKSGMTANIDMVTDKRENALAVPQRSVVSRNGAQYVMVKTNNNKTEERMIQTGLKGSDGMIEVISGLSEGEYVASTGNREK